MSIKKKGKSVKGAAKRKGPRSQKRKVSRPAKRKRTTSAAQSTAYETNWRAARDPERSDEERINAFAALTNAICDDPAVFKEMVEVLRDTKTSLAVRLAALGALQAASFSAIKFNAFRPAYMAALRAIATDPEPEMRQRALGLLSREGDG